MQYDTYIHTKIHQMKLKHKQYNKQLVLTKRVNDNLLSADTSYQQNGNTDYRCIPTWITLYISICFRAEEFGRVKAALLLTYYLQANYHIFTAIVGFVNGCDDIIYLPLRLFLWSL